ncbi:MAG: dihydropteroate synthase [Candidatus Methanolliviera sp. GoM_asphalt]|nr:MAG: dihydropteroate synthase [Candidatus Methanolliviera sp. GoM_asphalt]
MGVKKISFGGRTLIMGILNVTPNSFYEGGRFLDAEEALEHGLKLVEEGADIIDIGGESTHPGALPVSAEEEERRILPVIRGLKNEIDVPISVDTYKAEVAEAAIKAGASMINDISALRFDEKMVRVAAEYDVAVSLMHMKGTPRDMQSNPYYEDVMGEIISFLKERIKYALDNGISENKIVIDPGIGFGKRTGREIEDNCIILRRLKELKSFKKPILVGTSRKTFIGNICNKPLPEERLDGSLATVAIAVANGADIVRVHDVKETKSVVAMVDEIVR